MFDDIPRAAEASQTVSDVSGNEEPT
jgi:hypothetical protein